MPVDHTCGECGHALCLITADVEPSCGICSACTFLPGWFRDPQVRAMLDPDHDGVEVLERDAATRRPSFGAAP